MQTKIKPITDLNINKVPIPSKNENEYFAKLNTEKLKKFKESNPPLHVMALEQSRLLAEL